VIQIERDEHWRYFPRVVDETPCRTSCKSLCVDVCAGVHEDTSLWKREPIPVEHWVDFTIGHVDSAWIGYSTDPEIRKRGTSGGIIVGLLVHLLETRRIDGVLLVGSNRADPLQHDIKVATTRAEIEDAWGSKYYPMPIASKFRELMERDKRYAVVLLGCHMRSLRLMERRIRRLRQNIVLRVGIICGYCSGFKGLLDQAEDWQVPDRQAITRIDYREGVWPGNVRIQAPNFDKRTLIYNFLMRLPFTTNQRCMMCSDLMNETADITMGDAWLRELTERKDEGWSVMAIRNPAAAELVMAAQREGALYLEPIDVQTFIRSQEKPMRYKKNALPVRMAFMSRVLGTGLPDYDFTRFQDSFKTNIWNRLGNRLFLTTMSLFFPRDRLRRWMYDHVPRAWVTWYVRSIFLMIAHEGETSFLRKWLLKKDPALNCDA
jgi:coenzyme F420-reducing hydrogenase beta subunit